MSCNLTSECCCDSCMAEREKDGKTQWEGSDGEVTFVKYPDAKMEWARDIYTAIAHGVVSLTKEGRKIQFDVAITWDDEETSVAALTAMAETQIEHIMSQSMDDIYREMLDDIEHSIEHAVDTAKFLRSMLLGE